MSFYAIIFIFSLILIVISVIRYFYKTRESKAALAKRLIADYIIKMAYICLLIVIIVMFCFNLPTFSTNTPEIIDVVIVNVSILNLCVSLMIFKSSFTSKNKSDIVLEFLPTRFFLLFER